MRYLTLLALLTVSGKAQSPPKRTLPSTAVPISGMSPFPEGCAGPQSGGGSVFFNSTTEPYVTADPVHPEHLVGAWQQDRWTNGGSNGVVSAVSKDHGRTWTTSSAHFSRCTGGVWERASDPWVAISPDGTAYQAALGVNGAGVLTPVLVSRSADGGFTWDEPTLLSNNPGDDKESITADPTDSHYVYVVWDNTNTNDIPIWFSRTTDGGATWEPSRQIYNPGANSYATASQIVVLPDGTLLDVFVLTAPNGGRSPGVWNGVLRSVDHGATWKGPTLFATNQTVGTLDVKNKVGLRTGAGIPSVSADPVSGAVYVVWSDSRFSGGLRDGIAFSKSLDGGTTWSPVVQVNQVPQVQAFTPAVAAGADGNVAVTYFDFRQDTSDSNTLLAAYWRVVSEDGGDSWRETRVAAPFDILSAPLHAGSVPFLGDYQGIVMAGDVFLSFYTLANSGNTDNRSSLFASSAERPGDTRWTSGRIEINTQPHQFHAAPKPIPDLPLLRNQKH
ncbi:MAG TPA: sialidase family protein [Bryobacteraceae bacterium]|nr:sialidase family protein [Bryobacteraceae bacterium]